MKELGLLNAPVKYDEYGNEVEEDMFNIPAIIKLDFKVIKNNHLPL